MRWFEFNSAKQRTKSQTVSMTYMMVAMFTLIVGMSLVGIGCSSSDSKDAAPTGNPPKTFSVNTVVPSDGATSVSPSASVSVTFSQAPDQATLTSANCSINGVASSISVSGNTATITPNSSLAEGQSYTVSVSTAVADADGTALKTAFNSSFTTGTMPVADAGSDQDINAGDQVTLSGSSNLAGSPTYNWTQIYGPSVGALSGQSPVFYTPDTVSTLMFELRVDDGSGSSAPDTVVLQVVEKRSATYWVSSSGNDANPGTRSAPMLTINAAITMAASNGGDVYLAAGTYDESVVLEAGVSVYGGYNANTWLRDITFNQSTINGGSTAVFGQMADGVTLDGLTIIASDATKAGQSSIGIAFAKSKNVTITRNQITAGAGMAGAAVGTPSRPGTANDGSNGTKAGACSNPGGSGGSGSGRKGGKGGNGGAAGGFKGGAGDAPCGSGGGGGNGGFAASGKGGSDGCPGGIGANATVAGPGFGSVVSGVYVPALGSLGGRGGSGGGGGGGGGGAGSLFGCGGGGGGGGAGGIGGYGGYKGNGGGASIGIILSDTSSAVLADNHIMTNKGGNASAGGNGGAGGYGGDGGSGGGSATAGWAGGGGGDGGNAGAGGLGSGGGGGPSIGIVEQASTSTQMNLTFTLGQGGAGGVRSDGKGITGIDGEVAENKKLQ